MYPTLFVITLVVGSWRMNEVNLLFDAADDRKSWTPAVGINGWYRWLRGLTVFCGVCAWAEDNFFSLVKAEASGVLTGICIENGKRFHRNNWIIYKMKLTTILLFISSALAANIRGQVCRPITKDVTVDILPRLLTVETSSGSASVTDTPSYSQTSSPSPSASRPQTPTRTRSVSRTRTMTKTRTRTPTRTRSRSHSRSSSRVPTKSRSRSKSRANKPKW
jgi:hypothetical protein